MANITEMKEAIDKLINSDEEVSIPGLDFDSVIDNFIEQKYKENLSLIKDETERKNMKNNLITYYSNEARDEFENAISDIKSNFVAVKDGLKNVSEAVAASIASNQIPSVITVGTATSTANPIYVLIENKQKKNTLLSILKNIGNFLVNILKSAAKIFFQVPDMIMSLIEILTDLKKVVNSIPV
jgi:phage-related holin